MDNDNSDDEILLPGQQGAADAFVASYGHCFRYVPQWRKYVSWDGKRWDTDAGDTIVHGLWQQHLRDRVRDALDSGERVRGTLGAIADISTAHYERSIISLCQARTVADYRAFNADPYLLNCNNGILNLRTGVLHPHDPAELCTRLAPVDWQPQAACNTWEGYLIWAMQGDYELVDYLQRLFGLCLTGDAEHELAHFFIGDGGNGKTTVVKTIETILGDYALRANARMLMQRKHESHPTELASLYGRRLVVLAETNENQTIDEQMLKLVSSKDPIPARRMREDEWNYVPTHKAILLTNNKPRVRGQDAGVWRRIVNVPWNASVTEAEKDPHLAEMFVPEYPGILQWAWDGLQQVLRSGLRPPDSVRQATESYRNDEDSLPRWVAVDCLCQPGISAPSAELYAAYSAWAERTFETRLTQTAFGRRLTALGFEDRKGSGGVRLRAGLRLRFPP